MTQAARGRFPAVPRRAMAIAALALAAALVVPVLYFFDPAATPWYPRCAFHMLTGWRCPGCGMFRALHQLLHGNLSAAFALNPLAVLALPFLGYAAGAWISPRMGGPGLPMTEPSSRMLWILAVVIVVFTAMRNAAGF